MRVEKARILIRKNRFRSYEVAKKIGVAPSNFSLWFRDEETMTEARLKKIEDAVTRLLEEESNV